MFKMSRIERILTISIIVLMLIFINYPSFNLTIGFFKTGSGQFIFPSIYGTFINTLLFYINANILIPRFLRQKNHALFYILLISLFSFLSLLEIILDSWVLDQKIYIKIDSGYDIILLVVIVHLLIVLASFAYRFMKDWFKNEDIKRRFAEEQLISELAFLKSQINPHFLFNTLNNLFAMALKKDDQDTANGIEKLADMMRYMLYTSRQDKIMLIKELEYLENYISLQKLRLKDNTLMDLQYKFDQETIGQKISPMILIPFLENAFNYGVSNNQACFIHISLNVENNKMFFKVNNSINDFKRNLDESGVGLINVKKRLELLYSNKYKLLIDNNGKEYKLSLELDLA